MKFAVLIIKRHGKPFFRAIIDTVDVFPADIESVDVLRIRFSVDTFPTTVVNHLMFSLRQVSSPFVYS